MVEFHSSTSALAQPNNPSPLMQPVAYQGETYFASHYFHHEYLSNSPHGGKYRQHSNFLQAIRAIPAYAKYLASADIVELSWNALKASNYVPNEIFICFKALFQAVGYRPLTLLNGVAQLALHERLDDELSKQLSVAKNTQAARQLGQKSLGQSTPLELATRDMTAWMAAAKIFATPPHIAMQEGGKMIGGTYGVDFRPLLKAAPSQEHIPDEEVMLEPTALAKEVGMSSAVAMNRVLATLGLQVRAIGGGWEPTPAGLPYATRVAYLSQHNTHSGYHWKWQVTAVKQTLKHAGLVPL